MRGHDKYVYPGTNVLVNKFGCRDEKELKHIEALSTGGNLAYLQLHPIEGNFDFQHLRNIHFFIFQDLFDWAGEIRDVDIGNRLFVIGTLTLTPLINEPFHDTLYQQSEEKHFPRE